MPEMLLHEFGLVFAAFAIGGILKGAIGAGAPILAVPIMAIIVDVPFAVAMFILPNILSNCVQGWQFRRQLPAGLMIWRFALFGAIGAGVGTLGLTELSGATLSAAVAGVVLSYVGFRLAKPDWRLETAPAARLAVPVGAIAGVLQGATGVSAPVSLSFMNAQQLERGSFIAAMSVFFASMALVQLPVQLALGVMTSERMLFSLLAAIPLMMFMPVGHFLARHIPRIIFDRIILVFLTFLAVRLLWDVVQ